MGLRGCAHRQRVPELEGPVDQGVPVLLRPFDQNLPALVNQDREGRVEYRPRKSGRRAALLAEATTSTKAATSWLVISSRALISPTVKLARSRQAAAARADHAPPPRRRWQPA